MKANIHQTARCLLSAAALAALTACGGGGSGPASTVTPPPPATYTVGGTVTGLTGSGLVLQTNAGDVAPVSDQVNGDAPPLATVKV